MCSENKDFQESIEEFIPKHTEVKVTSEIGDYSSTLVPERLDKYERARMLVNVSFPSCPNQYHLEGSLTINYRNGKAFITRPYQIQRSDENENKDLTWIIRGFFGTPSDGNASINGSSKCVFHGVNNSGLPF